uniref:phosphate ABC transporter substrate-binding protein n=1 Tax=Thaumasiovibrio occultus TaxID=1891184 RepID=UPI000B34FED2|nr:phosphate ABC transporter substrate-binding protein [Thaumasiovibrio occultus]
MLKKTAVVTALFALSHTSSYAATETVSISGSTSVSRVIEVLAEVYNQQQDTVVVEVHGTSSSAGINAVRNGATDLGMSSRYLLEEEIQPDLHTVEIAKDAIAIVVHPDNPVSAISSAQLNEIYQHKLTNWQQLGGEDSRMAVVSRENASGTRYSFEAAMDLLRNVNGETVSGIHEQVLVANANSMVKTLVNHNRQAIGYASLGSVDDSIKALTVNGVAATGDNALSGEYELNRPFLLMYQGGSLDDNEQAFINFVLSAQGQQIVAEFGYLPVDE